ncbi:MAG: MBOAT family protein [Clostridia bacterium]|nr:MBOAT family protein [Clostridia bacterium]
MVFSSAVFLFFFLPLTTAVYYLIPARMRNAALFAASLLFYAWGEPLYVLIMLFSTFFDYFNGLALEKWDGRPGRRKAVLVVSVAVNIGMLCFFKYTDFVIGSFNSVFGSSVALLKVALPVGISFYTFQTLSYTIDVYRRKVKAQHNIIDFGMYISMYPQLIAGPIVRYADIESQISGRKYDPRKAAQGLFRFTAGLCKKVLIANQLGAVWDDISSRAGTLPAATAWLGALAFAFQIYFDFSGYSDMAIGLGALLGFKLPENFDHPYESNSVTEFWRRWHITLGVWFREYVYIPLGGNRKGVARQLLNMLVVWALTGLWHGAGVNFILWGLYFFVFLALEKLFLLKFFKKIPRVFGHIYTLAVVLFSWVIFACEDTGTLWSYIRDFFGANGFCGGSSGYYLMTCGVMFAVAAVFSTHYPKKAGDMLIGRLRSKPVLLFSVRTAVALVFLALCIVFIVGDAYNPFLYFRF